MALAIDTEHLLDRVKDKKNLLMDAELGSGGRFQLRRVCVYTDVGELHGQGSEPEDAVVMDWRCSRAAVDRQPALDWQAAPDDDLDELEVFRHLKQLDACRWVPSSSNGNNAAAATLVANVQTPTFSARLQDRPASSFQRFSLRRCGAKFRRLCRPGMSRTESNFVYKTFSTSFSTRCHIGNLDWPHDVFPNIVGANTRQEYLLYWQVQYDYVDLHTPRLMSTQRPGKRRRTLNPFHQVSWRRQEADTSRAHHPPDAKRFDGVRFRPDRNRWVAEMKPPRCKNKVSFGDFQSQAEAARVVDVAFHYYGKPLKFADTPQILSARPPLPEQGPEDKLKFVKEQAKWLASIASTLASSSSSPFPRGTSGIVSSLPSPEIPELRSFSEISSPLGCGGADEADDGVSQPPPSWVPPNPMASIYEIGLETMEPDLTAADHTAVTTHFGEGQSTSQGSAENATADPYNNAFFANFASGTFPDLVNSPGLEQSSEFQSMCMDFLLMSPPAPAFQVLSPGDFQRDVADRLLEEQENFD